MKCKICNAGAEKIFEAIVLKKYNVKYFHCTNCGFLFTEEPYWLNESYTEAINNSDTGLLERNYYFLNKISVLLYFLLCKNGKYLDYAGGYGVFTRLMRDVGFNFYWFDIYAKNIFAKGFEINQNNLNEISKDISENKKEFTAVTAFEVFEHLKDPVPEIEKMLKLSNTIIFSTQLIPDEIPAPDWWYYAFEHGQHISFYSHKTIDFIARKYNMNFYGTNGIYMITKKKINSSVLKSLLKFSKLGAAQFVRSNMQSLTIKDSEKLK